MQSLGRIKSPITGKIEKDFNQTRQAIDMLKMLKEKTSGNLSPELSESFNTLLNESSVRYLQESNKT